MRLLEQEELLTFIPELGYYDNGGG